VAKEGEEEVVKHSHPRLNFVIKAPIFLSQFSPENFHLLPLFHFHYFAPAFIKAKLLI
jgi:hypothetical protein